MFEVSEKRPFHWSIGSSSGPKMKKGAPKRRRKYKKMSSIGKITGTVCRLTHNDGIKRLSLSICPDYFIGDFKQNLKVKYHWVTKSIFLSLHGR